MMTHTSSSIEIVHEAYDRLHRYGPEFGGDDEGNHGMTNHGSMAVEVQARRGIDVDIDQWLDRYIPRLDDRPAGRVPIMAGTWRAALGDHRRVPDWTDWFAA